MENPQLKILLVEDNPAHVEMIRRNFQGFQLATELVQVGDGQAALDYLQSHTAAGTSDASPPDLILLDLRLPRVDGLEVLRTLKSSAKLREIPVVVLTTSANRQDIAQAYTLGCNGYLVKPAGFRKFAEMMSALSAYWLGWNRYPR